jgi:hypothetical protein
MLKKSKIPEIANPRDIIMPHAMAKTTVYEINTRFELSLRRGVKRVESG